MAAHAAELIAEIACPSCRRTTSKRVRIAAETTRRAAKRPATPELVAVCPRCRDLMVLSLRPALAEAVAS